MTAVQTSKGIRGSDIVMAVGAVVMVAAQIAIPLTQTTPGLSTFTVCGMAVIAFGGVWRAWGIRSAVLIAACVLPFAFCIELLGSRTGYPFGSYSYTGRLRPALWRVPVIVPLAWFGMGTAAYATVQFIVRNRYQRIVLGALALTAWDVFLDPQMVRAGFWDWRTTTGPAFRGIPWTNYLGWFVAALLVMGVISAWSTAATSLPLFALYAWFAIMQTIGFLFFFDDILVGVVGGCAMLPFLVLAWWRSEHV